MSRRPDPARVREAGFDVRPSRVLGGAAGDGARVLLLGLEELGDECWTVLTAAGVKLARVATVADAVRALTADAAEIVIADARQGPALAAAVRAGGDLASAHIVVCTALDSPERAERGARRRRR